MSLTSAKVTQMLQEIQQGNKDRINDLLPVVYQELRRLASGYLRREREGHTLQATEIVNEVYLKMIARDDLNFNNRSHFFAIAANGMRQLLIDYARRHNAAKRGGGAQKIELDEGAVLSKEQSTLILALDEALQRLAVLDERQARVVELRYFSGLNVEETAEALGVSPATVKREWRSAKAWLYRELKSG